MTDLYLVAAVLLIGILVGLYWYRGTLNTEFFLALLVVAITFLPIQYFLMTKLARNVITTTKYAVSSVALFVTGALILYFVYGLDGKKPQK